MSLNASKVEQPKRKITVASLEPATYPVRLVQVFDLGIQPQEFKGEPKPSKRQMSVTYECLDEFMLDEDGNEDPKQPRWLFEDFPLNHLDSDKATSTLRYMALDPTKEQEGEWRALLGNPGLLNIVNKPRPGDADHPYENVAGLAPMRKKDADAAPALVNPTKIFIIEDADAEMFGTLPQWMQDKIKTAEDFAGSDLEAALKGGAAKTETKADESKDGDDKEDW